MKVGKMKALSFCDVLVIPRFSSIISRKDVNTSINFLGEHLETPIMSSNMDTVTEHQMATAITKAGGIGCVHRFMSIEDNVRQVEQSPQGTFFSVGLGNTELERAKALYDAGAYNYIIDVAHGASVAVVAQYERLRELLPDANIVVGNFATGESIRQFSKVSRYKLQAVKLGIGGGSLCTTRVVTGCGLPTLQTIIDCKSLGIPMIADGGIKNSGDIAKALVAGADLVMLGGLLAGTEESPGAVIKKIKTRYDAEVDYNSYSDYFQRELTDEETKADLGARREIYGTELLWYKQYRGSASKESYEVQGKVAEHRTPEGESTLVPYKGPVIEVVNNLTAGLKSALSYVGASNIEEFKEQATLIEITHSSHIESKPHGKN